MSWIWKSGSSYKLLGVGPRNSNMVCQHRTDPGARLRSSLLLFFFPPPSTRCEAAVESWQVCSSWLAVWGLCHYSGHFSSEQFCVTEEGMHKKKSSLMAISFQLNVVFFNSCWIVHFLFKQSCVAESKGHFNSWCKGGRRSSLHKYELALCTWMTGFAFIEVSLSR